MSDDLTNSEIALLCDIGELHLPKLTGDQKRDLERLIAGGYVGPTESRVRSAFMLTAKGVCLEVAVIHDRREETT
jgi:hypothetical protein